MFRRKRSELRRHVSRKLLQWGVWPGEDTEKTSDQRLPSTGAAEMHPEEFLRRKQLVVLCPELSVDLEAPGSQVCVLPMSPRKQCTVDKDQRDLNFTLNSASDLVRSLEKITSLS